MFAFCAEITRLPGHCAPRFVRKSYRANNAIAVYDGGPHMVIQAAGFVRSRLLDGCFQLIVMGQIAAGYIVQFGILFFNGDLPRCSEADPGRQ